MTRYVTLPSALVIVGIALLIAPAAFPVHPVLYHDTSPGTMANETVLEDDGFTVIAYENLSTRGQEYYVQALRNNGQSIVPQDKAAREFRYPTTSELSELDDPWTRMTLESIIIERPVNSSLPPPDEPVDEVEHRLRGPEEPTDGASGESPENGRSTEHEPSMEELRERTARYDQMATRTDLPPLFAPKSLLRLLSVTFGASAIGLGGYLRSTP